MHFATGSFFNFNGTAGAHLSCALLARRLGTLCVSTDTLSHAAGVPLQVGEVEDSLVA